MSVIALQQYHGLIPVVVVATAFVNVWASFKVGAARKKYEVPYPQMYAEKSDKNAKAFNCVQRAHQNMLENIPIFFAVLFTSAVYRPLPAAIFGAIRVLGFIVYVHGYSTGVPSKRLWGAFGFIGLLGSIVLTMEVALKVLEIL